MKIYRGGWSILCCLMLNIAFAQDKKETFRIVQTDTTGFPKVRVTVELTANVQPLKNDFAVLNEQQEKIEILGFERKSSGGSTAPSGEAGAHSSRLIYFLIDASNYTYGMPIQNFKSALSESFGLFTDNDLVAAGSFSSDSPKLNHLNRDFDANRDLTEDKMRRINASMDSTGKSDVLKAMYDALDFFKSSRKDGQKILVVISGAILGTSRYASSDIIERARKLGVVIYCINYRTSNDFSPDALRIISDKTEGIATEANTSTDIKNAIGDALETRPNANSEATSDNPRYTIDFEVPNVRDGLEHSFKISYAGTEQVGYYTAGGGGNMGGFAGFFRDYGLIVIIVLGLLVGLGYWQYNEMRLRRLEEEEAAAEEEAQRQAEIRRLEQDKQRQVQDLQEKNVRLQEQLRLKEQEIARQKVENVPTVVPASKFDPKLTQIGAGGSAPVLQVAAGAFSQNFRLNKPTMTIGRAPNNDIVIPEATVSSHHSQITIEGGSFFITDLGSTNGTFVNGTRVDKKLLKNGDLIKFGGANARFELG